MPVNTAALKTFAPAMRRKLLEAVGRKLDLLLNSQTPDTLSTYAKQIAELREQEEENREQLLERVAYTWFNRLCALRYLDARGWHPFGCKVLMPAAECETQPELLKLMRAGNLPAALQGHTDQDRLHGLLDGQIQTAIAGADPQAEVYRQLVLAVCRCYHELLPNLFEGLDDASELLLPDDLLSDGSIVGAFRKEITEDDCQDVESLGWLYQFYIAEKKDEVMARKKAVPTEDIPAVTQLFTPHWIVRYLVENSLGRLWLLNRPGSRLLDQMPYYIEGDVETDFLVINKPEEIKLLDPACGSGHMLTYAFDLLVLIYEEEGYSPNEIPGLILKHNLHGLEICPRAAQLAELALVFKAREQSRRFFQPEQLVRPQIIELQDVRFEEGELNDYIEALDLGELFDPNLFKLLHQFEEAKNYGSLIRPCLDERAIADFRRTIEAKDIGRQLLLRETRLKVLRVLEQAEALTQRYHVVVANPPYMGSGNMGYELKAYAAKNYPDSKADLFSAFIELCINRAKDRGIVGMVTMHGWMYLASHAKLRARVLGECSIQSLVHIGFNSFPELNSKVALAAAFVLRSHPKENEDKSIFVGLNSFSPSHDKHAVFMELLAKRDFFLIDSSNFELIPGSPFAYQLGQDILEGYRKHGRIFDHGQTASGLQTNDNSRFIRYWFEVSEQTICRTALSREDAKISLRKWYPHVKGGGRRRWYGNLLYVVNWLEDGKEILALATELYGSASRTAKNMDLYFQSGVTWTDIGIDFGARLLPASHIFDTAAPSLFGDDLIVLLSYLQSSIAAAILRSVNPTLHFLSSDVANLPFPAPSAESREYIIDVASKLIEIYKEDWDEKETSSTFFQDRLLTAHSAISLSESGASLEKKVTTRTRDAFQLESRNSDFWRNQYGISIQNGIDHHVVNDDQLVFWMGERLAAFLSYATGCMMGRYSLDEPGLILADARESQSDQLSAYEEKVGRPLSEVQFKPDPDGIIPVLDGEWFEDDIVARTREFLEVTFPESTVTENLRFIEESLGKDIRKYFCSEFYKDHLQTYKKRPIYWMVQSPKKGFACLIYLHRYTKDTLNQVLNNYFRPYLQKLEARLAQLGLDQLNDALPTRERTAARKEAEKITKVLKECESWEQDSLLPLAQQRIELDLDDGVKVNYLKLQDVLAPIPGLAAKED